MLITGLFGSAPHLTSPAGTHSVLRFDAERILQHLCTQFLAVITLVTDRKRVFEEQIVYLWGRQTFLKSRFRSLTVVPDRDKVLGTSGDRTSHG